MNTTNMDKQDEQTRTCYPKNYDFRSFRRRWGGTEIFWEICLLKEAKRIIQKKTVFSCNSR